MLEYTIEKTTLFHNSILQQKYS